MKYFEKQSLTGPLGNSSAYIKSFLNVRTRTVWILFGIQHDIKSFLNVWTGLFGHFLASNMIHQMSADMDKCSKSHKSVPNIEMVWGVRTPHTRWTPPQIHFSLSPFSLLLIGQGADIW